MPVNSLFDFTNGTNPVQLVRRLDSIISALYVDLNYPDWLTMLSRNCEYTIDVKDFRKPFEDEFQYLYELWKDASSVEE